MGRSPCCEKVGMKKGPWTPEEDQKLLAYIEEHGHGSWRALPFKAGLQRCGKSCRLRWTNYLRPDIKRGKFSLQEEQTIIQLHALLGNRWSSIASHLAKRTDNEIKNYWNTHLKKRLAKMGIDPVTHKPKNNTLRSTDGQTKNAANLSHMAQWESARLEAEARLVRESKLRSQFPSARPWNCCRDGSGTGDSLESPTSTITFTENEIPANNAEIVKNTVEFVGTSGSSETGIMKENVVNQHHQHRNTKNSLPFNSSTLQNMTTSLEDPWTPESMRRTDGSVLVSGVEEGFTGLLLNDLDDSGQESSENNVGGGNDNGSDYYEDKKNYWNGILNLLNSSPPNSPIF